MTIQPPHVLVERSAEQRPPLDPDSTGRRPLPDGWCYACWLRVCRDPGFPDWHKRPQPDTLTATAERIASRVLSDAEMPLHLSGWHAGQLALVRAVAVELNLIVTCAEQYNAHQ